MNLVKVSSNGQITVPVDSRSVYPWHPTIFHPQKVECRLIYLALA